MSKLWGGRFTGKTDPVMEQFNLSLDVDKVMWAADVDGSIAYSRALEKASVISAEEGSAIAPDVYYRYQAQVGFTRVPQSRAIESDPTVVQGRWLQCIWRRDFDQPEARRAAKHITRQALQGLLGDKPLISRKMLGSR